MPKPSAGTSYPCSSPASSSMSSREGARKRTRGITVNCHVRKRMLLVVTTVIVSSVCGCALAVQPGAALHAARTQSPHLKEAVSAHGASGLSWLPREDENVISAEIKDSSRGRSELKLLQPASAWMAAPAQATQSTGTQESQAAATGLAAGLAPEPAAAEVGEKNSDTAGNANGGSTGATTKNKRLRADSYSAWTAESEEHPLVWLGGKRRDEEEAVEEDKKGLPRDGRKDVEGRAHSGGEHSSAEHQEEETRGENEERDKRSRQDGGAVRKWKSTDEKERNREGAVKVWWMRAEGDAGAHGRARQEGGVPGEGETEETSEEEDVSAQAKERTKQGEAQEETQAGEEEHGEEERRVDSTETKEDEEEEGTGKKKDDRDASAERKEEEGVEEVRARLVSEKEEGAREVEGGGLKSSDGYTIPKLDETEARDVDGNAREEATQTEKQEGEEEEGANANRNEVEETEEARQKETQQKEKVGEENMVAEAPESEEEGETGKREGVGEIEEDEHATSERKETGEHTEEREQKSEDRGKANVSAEAKEREEWEETQEESEEDDDEGEDGEDASALGSPREEHARTGEEGKRDMKDAQSGDWMPGRAGEAATNEDSEGNEHEERVVVQSLPEREPQPRPRPLLSEYMSTLYLGHPPCPFPNAPWCGVETTRDDRSPGRSSEMTQRSSTFASPILSLPFADSSFRFPYLWSAEGADTGYYGAAKVDIQRCRLTFTLDPLEPMDEIRLYMIPSERRVGIAANRKVKRSEERKAYFRVYGVETRWHTGGSIAEGCMASEELLKAGLIGWTYSGVADGGIKILVSFPSEAHAKDLLERKELREASYKLFLGGESLEQLTPLEKCALSGRTRSECDRLKEESGVAHLPVVVFSAEGFADEEVMIPEFIYA